MSVDDEVTVLVTASPIPSHPASHVLDCTVESVRRVLPDARLLVLFDGPRPDRPETVPAYTEHIDRVRDRVDYGEWGNAETVVHANHVHQARMIRAALDVTNTGVVFVLEHDTPLCGVIDIDTAVRPVASGALHHLRFSYSTTIYEGYKHLFPDWLTVRDFDGCPALRTVQYSQRPHLAGVDWYKRLIDDHCPENWFVEDQVHGPIVEAWEHHGEAGWTRFRLAVYAPDPLNCQTSLHLDGRKMEPK